MGIRAGDKVAILKSRYAGHTGGDIFEVTSVGAFGVFLGGWYYDADDVRLVERCIESTIDHVMETHHDTLVKLAEYEKRDKYETGVKFDNGKPSISLAYSGAINGMLEALAYGAKKYEKHNYRKGYEWTRALDAAVRHILAELECEGKDEESGLEHWKHAIACLNMYAWFKEQNAGVDDRFNKAEKKAQ